MRVVGYTYSWGIARCVKHATDLTDEGDSATGQATPVFDIDRTDSNIVCCVPGCGVILEANEPDPEA